MNIEKMIELIKIAHMGQKDKSGKEYYLHPLSVMSRLGDRAGLDIRIAALGHDIIEDVSVTELVRNAAVSSGEVAELIICHARKISLIETKMEDFSLMMGLSKRAIEIIKGVTREKDNGQTYIEWIRDIADDADVDIIALKLADNYDNSSEERIASLPEEMRSIKKKYDRSIKILKPALDKIMGAAKA